MADVLGDAVKVYHTLLQEDDKAKDYLESRGVHPKSIDYFNLGATSDSGKFYYHMKKDHDYSDAILEQHGLIYSNSDVAETFRDSAIIPFLDTKRRVFTISARKYNDHKVKYMNLPKFPIIDLFAINTIANRHIYSKIKGMENYVFLSEGQFDTIMLQQKGLMALGVPGVHNLREQMFEHLRWFDHIIICYDNDHAGDSGGNKLASLIKYYYPKKKLYKVIWPEETKDKGDVSDFFMNGYKASDLVDLIKEIKKITPASIKSKTGVTNPNQFSDLKNIPLLTFIERIKKGTQWKKTSTGIYKTECPFTDHNDTVSSFTVYNDSNSYFCFGCGRGGDIINFCCEFFNVSFKTGINILKRWKEEHENTSIRN